MEILNLTNTVITFVECFERYAGGLYFSCSRPRLKIVILNVLCPKYQMDNGKTRSVIYCLVSSLRCSPHYPTHSCRVSVKLFRRLVRGTHAEEAVVQVEDHVGAKIGPINHQGR